MTEIRDQENMSSKDQDWALIPFDEAEDDARWERLIEETDQLIEEVNETEKIYGVLLTENKLSDLVVSEQQSLDEPF